MKKYGIFLLCTLCLFFLYSCGEQPMEKQPDPAEITNAILQNVSTEMVELKDKTLTTKYDFPENTVEKASVFICSSGALADEVAIVKAVDKSALDKIKQVFETRKQDIYDSFVDYVPTEIPKVETSVIATKGNYALLAVLEDAGKAKEIFEKAFQG